MRNGIIAAGNWIVDQVKLIDAWPERGMLANILEEYRGTGGAPFNVLVDLAKLQSGLPLYAAGMIGRDPDGDFILEVLAQNGIDIRHMTRTAEQSTSITQVMTEAGSGVRTFFHSRGANALLDLEHLTGLETSAKIFHLGYLLLLDKLDGPDPQYGVKAARLLHRLREEGYRTSVDVVSEASDRFRRIVIPCLPYIDYLIVNEIEAGASVGYPLRDSDRQIVPAKLAAAAQTLLDSGVNQLVAVHFPEGAYAIPKGGRGVFVPSFEMESAAIKGTVGAGDAFCAAMLFGIHQDWPLFDTVRLANANARFCLTDATSTGGAVPLGVIREYLRTARPRPFEALFDKNQ
ncbi:sugar/nucleoside kinase (ribokinase family) [Hydrogenispora ethanolica]|jgi:sugar/nucleoside kinase (ribokinase family)|uniref:Sugar/nucleoside kinase (Ribokinase family) n=1 Tax=Hydrogenispora ethanolica TaxID=1082276 RepID=A0A4R1RYE7_HYDET|nr:carbohydrate kinase family protein [Hydrogenispora ethanolica]TCL71599.1 sugar/nucleoside kinase (ribokinase family) [Hydrogenispora ethanolica]